MKLPVNQPYEVPVVAKKTWNDTGIDIAPGEEYRFEAKGYWRDLTIRCDADGYTHWFMKLSEPFRRSRSNQWFALMGSLDKRADFLIGKSKTVSFDRPARLFCYANDVKGFYWNNFGRLLLTVTRLK